MVNHIIDRFVFHPAYPDLTLRGYYASLGDSDSGKTKGLEFAMHAMNGLLREYDIHSESLFFYKSEQTLIRGLSSEGTIKRDKNGNAVSGHPGHPSQFLYVKEGNQLATGGEHFAGVFSSLTNLYDQEGSGSSSITNGVFKASGVKVSAYMCFTPSDFAKVFGGKGSIGSGGLNRWGMVCPPMNHDYDAKDWERLPGEVIAGVVELLTARIREIRQGGLLLKEEPGAAQIRLVVKKIAKEAGPIGKRAMDYFIREQINRAAMSLESPFVMTEEQARDIQRWVEMQLACRLDNWPPDSGNQVEAMEHKQRRAVNRCHTSLKTLRDACDYYREGTGGIWTFNSALRNNLDAKSFKLTGRTRKGMDAFCPIACSKHAAVSLDERKKRARN